MKFLTETSIAVFPFKIEPQSRLLIMGSCFADQIGERLLALDSTLKNPFGVLYNPLSIARCAAILQRGQQFSADDLDFRDNLWHSFCFHGSFSAPSREEVLLKINRPSKECFDYIIVTLGTAYVYERDGEVVSNCHKFPEAQFVRRRATVEECYEALQRVAMLYPMARIIVTVSPIRYMRDGLAANFVSKATLRLAIDQLCKELPDRAFYFPSYEILVDELRDYRFTDIDMCHPTEQAVEYIWQKFALAALSATAVERVAMAAKASVARRHQWLRPPRLFSFI